MDVGNEEISKQALARAIREFREKAGYPHETIQYMTGLSRTSQWNYENHKTHPTIPNLRLLCKEIFKCKLSELIIRAEEIEIQIINEMKSKWKKRKRK